jgi:hypothetical protein
MTEKDEDNLGKLIDLVCNGFISKRSFIDHINELIEREREMTKLAIST